MNCGDTIAAISSALGSAARIIVRVSGPSATSIAAQVGVPADHEGGSARRCSLTFSDLSVPSWVYLFRAPHSYTGDDLAEFHLPGSPVLAKLLLEELLRLGARPAEPGEFTARAYFNGRMDLTEAEGVAATIAAGNEQELAAARRLLSGELARRLVEPMDLIADTLALVEVGIDFSEEDVNFLPLDQLTGRIARADGMLAAMLTDSARLERLAHEPLVVLAGRPNAGKSTLLNALAGRERAVVSAVAGTTRDVLSAQVVLRRGIIRLMDAAGVEDAQALQDAEEGRVESPHAHVVSQMRRHALRAVQTADLVLLVQEMTDSAPPLELGRVPALILKTKMDLFPTSEGPASAGDRDLREVRVSAVTGAGMEELRERLDALCFGQSASQSSLALNVRHVRAIDDARAALTRAADRLNAGRPELLALELREALDAVGAVLGRVTPDDLLGRIFSTFCIGK